jgi:transposase
MTPNQYRATLHKLGLSQREAGRILQVGERTSRRWASEGGIPETAAKLLRLAVAGKITVDDIEGA